MSFLFVDEPLFEGGARSVDPEEHGLLGVLEVGVGGAGGRVGELAHGQLDAVGRDDLLDEEAHDALHDGHVRALAEHKNHSNSPLAH